MGTRLPAQDVVTAVLAVRRTKGMVLTPGDPDNRCVGSVFLGPAIDATQAARLPRLGASPHTHPDGSTRVGSSWLLREAGYTLGQILAPGVRMSTKHLTLVADGHATADAFAKAAKKIRDHVADITGVTLTFEPDLIGEQPAFDGLAWSPGTKSAEALAQAAPSADHESALRQ